MTGDTNVFPSLEQVLAVHQRVLSLYGGADGLRDQNLVDSAVAMPRAAFGGAYLHDGIPAMAAAYLFHLCKNHPFVDGNKRCALASSIQFLYLNGYVLKASKQEVEELTLGVASGSVTKDIATAFFAKHSLQVA